MHSLSSAKPFAKKNFFLDLKGFQHENKLAQDLKLLGGKQELSMSKNVSFVVSNKIPVRSQLWSPATPSSNPRSMSPHLFNDSTMDGIYSPAYTDSPGIEQTPCIMSRGKSILQMAKGKKSGTSNIMDICKKWNIKVYHVQKVLSWLEKYKSVYYKNHLAERKNALKKFPARSEVAQKIHSPFIKFEDKGRKYKPKYKVLTSWTDIIDPSVSQFVSQLHKNLKITGNVTDTFRPPLKELDKPLCSAQPTLTNRSVSISKMSVISNSVSVYAPNDGGKENFSHSHVKRKEKDNKKKTKKRYCEICDVHFTELEMHVGKKSHERYMSDADHYKKVQDIISSLPQVKDFLQSAQDKIIQEDFQDYLFQEVPGSAKEVETDLTEDTQLQLQENVENCKTELYSVYPNDYISASCSSTDTSFPYLEPMCNDNVENQNDKDLGPPTIVYCNTVEHTRSYFRKSFLENFVMGNVDDIVPNLSKIYTNTNVENNLLSNYGTGSNSWDVQMEDAINQKQISKNSILSDSRNEMNLENTGMLPVTRHVLNSSGNQLKQAALSNVDNLCALTASSDNASSIEQTVETKSLDAFCPEVPLPSLIFSETGLSVHINSVTDNPDEMQVQAELSKDSTTVEMDVQDNLMYNVHGLPPEQSKSHNELNTQSYPTESASEGDLSCKIIINSVTEIDMPDSFTPQVHRFSIEQNKFCNELNTKSHFTKSAPESNITFNNINYVSEINKLDNLSHTVEESTKSLSESIFEKRIISENGIKALSNLSNDLSKSKSEMPINSKMSKDEKVNNIQAASCSRNLASEFAFAAIKAFGENSEVRNTDLNDLGNNRLSCDPSTSSETCSANYTSKNLCELSKETHVSEYLNLNMQTNVAGLKVNDCNLTESSLKDFEIKSYTQNNCQISKVNTELNEVDKVTLNVGSPDKLLAFKNSSIESLSFNIDAQNLNKNEESITTSIETSCSTAVPIMPSEIVQFSVSKVNNNRTKVSKYSGQPVKDFTSSSVQEGRTTNDLLPKHLNVINECSLNNNVSKTIKSNKPESKIARPILKSKLKSVSNSPESSYKNVKTHRLALANGETLPFSIESLHPDARKLLKYFFVNKGEDSSNSLHQEKLIQSPESYTKENEFSSSSMKDFPKTLDAWNSNNVYFVVDDVTPEKSPNSCNMDYHDDPEKVPSIDISCPVDISDLVKQDKESPHSSFSHNIPFAPITNSNVTVNPSSASAVENIEEKRNIDFMDSSSNSQPICKRDVILNGEYYQHNLSVSSSGSKLEYFNYFNEADFSSSPEKQNDWSFIHKEVDTLCKSIDAGEESSVELSNYQICDPLQLVMQH